MSEPTTLCVRCRKTFTDEEIDGATCCPNCGSTGVPADLSKKATLTLTHHEWRILFMWASNYAGACDGEEVVQGILREVNNQWPDHPQLTLMGELIEAVDKVGGTIITPEGTRIESITPKNPTDGSAA